MKVLLIMPDARMHKFRLGSYICSLREAPLTLVTLAALIPDDENIEWKLIDESVEPVPLDYPADLVGISVLTGTAVGAYRLSSHFRNRGIPVVLGGIHVTIMPGEAAEHADAIVTGMAERSWPELVRDFQAGQLKDHYSECDESDGFAGVSVVPRRDLLRQKRYIVSNSVQATRGCSRRCDFCTVSAVWAGFSRKPVLDVIADVRSIRRKTFVFNDVNLLDNAEYARELFTALKPLGKRWGGLATLDSLRDEEMVSLMARSGCIYVLTGFESVNQQGLQMISKGFNRVDEYKSIVDRLHRHGISVQGCFVFGMDSDDTSVFHRTVEFVTDIGIDIPRYSIYTPYPGTPLFIRLLKENRILSLNWNDYDTMHVVYRPALLSPEELFSGFKHAYRDTFSYRRIMRRCSSPGLSSVLNLAGNLTYRRFVSRLFNSRNYENYCSTVQELE